MVDSRFYEGRGPALVKHTFIERYLPTLIAKVASKYDKFTFVDLFAGPWNSRCADHSDTSFDIALRAMRGAKAAWKKNGRDVQMLAQLVEDDAEAFAQLKRHSGKYPDITILSYRGKAEDHVGTILSEIPEGSFSFFNFDPKGVPDLTRFRDMFERPSSEVLLTFMLKFAHRFAHTDVMPTLASWLNELGDDDERKSMLSRLARSDKEDAITEGARRTLSKLGDYEFAPEITVDELEKERTCYKLIFLTRHPKGMQVFREAQIAALQAQAFNRSGAKAAARCAKTGMEDLFQTVMPINPAERSAREIANGERDGRSLAATMIRHAGNKGILWKDVWPSVLDTCVVHYSQLGRILGDMRASSQIKVPNWTNNRIKIPRDDYRFFWNSRGITS